MTTTATDHRGDFYDEIAAAAADLLGLARFDCEQADAERRNTGDTPEHRALEQALPGNGARWATRQECADVANALGDEAPTYPARVGALRAALRRRIRREFS